MNKFIFLDIDGVMNSNLFYSERTQDKRYNDWIKEHEYLKHLIRKENENAQRANGCTY